MCLVENIDALSFWAAVFRFFCQMTFERFRFSFLQVDIWILLSDAFIGLFKPRGYLFEAQVKADRSCGAMRPFAPARSLCVHWIFFTYHCKACPWRSVCSQRLSLKDRYGLSWIPWEFLFLETEMSWLNIKAGVYFFCRSTTALWTCTGLQLLLVAGQDTNSTQSIPKLLPDSILMSELYIQATSVRCLTLPGQASLCQVVRYRSVAFTFGSHSLTTAYHSTFKHLHKPIRVVPVHTAGLNRKE